MTFRLVEPTTVDLTATLQPPDAEAGKITLTVRYLRVSERRQWIERLQDESQTLRDADFASEIVTGWDGITDADGAPIPYSADALAQVMDLPYVTQGITDALIEYLFGARAKNLLPSAEGGPAARPI